MFEVGVEGQSLKEISGHDLAGCIYNDKVFTLGLTTIRYRKLPPDAPEIVKRAHALFYPGLHEPYYPHVASLTRDPLVEILRMVEGKLVIKMEGIKPVDHEKRVNTLIRESGGLLSPDRTCVLFMSGYDSRLARQNEGYYPCFVRLVQERTFNEIMEIDPLAIPTALGCRPLVPLWGTPSEDHPSAKPTDK